MSIVYENDLAKVIAFGDRTDLAQVVFKTEINLNEVIKVMEQVVMRDANA